MPLSREVVIITGKTGYGKSTWLQQYAKRFSRIWAFDPFAKFPCNYLNEEGILNAAGVIDANTKFSLGSHNIDDLDLIGACSYLTGNNALVLEECGFIFNKGERLPDWLKDIVFLGRHMEVSLIVTAQRAAYIPIDLRSQANRVISFWQTELTDVDWLEQYYGERLGEIENLPIYTCLDYDGGKLTSYKLNKPT